MELQGSRDPVDLGYHYGSQPLQVSAAFQDQYPNYSDHRPPGDRQQFRPTNRPNYRQDYPLPVNRNPCCNCARVGHRMAECPEPESSMEFQQSVYDQVHGPGRGCPPRARNQRMPQGGLAYPPYDNPAPHQGRPVYDHPTPHQGRPVYDHPAPHQGRPAYDHPRQSVAQVAGVGVHQSYGGPSGELDPRIEEVNETEEWIVEETTAGLLASALEGVTFEGSYQWEKVDAAEKRTRSGTSEEDVARKRLRPRPVVKPLNPRTTGQALSEEEVAGAPRPEELPGKNKRQRRARGEANPIWMVKGMAKFNTTASFRDTEVRALT